MPRTPTVAFVVKGRTSDEVAEALAARAVFVSNGDFYATTVVRRLGHEADGLVRAGCACYTTAAEVDRLVDGVREIA
jgi:selenocysteine lyase/cysteine desulfurase